MNLQEFELTLNDKKPPENVSVYLKALWFDANDKWDEAHELIQDITDKTAAWIHAYLHRKEGDTWNADYWYRKAGKTRPDVSLEEEWKGISKELLMTV